MKNVANATNYLNMDTKELFKNYKETKDINIRNVLIERHLYLASILSKKYVNKGVEFEDIYQVASLALIYAIERYDIDKGFEFSSFATPTIIGEIKKYFRDKVWTLRVPRRVQDLNKKINQARLEFEQKNNKYPKIEDIAEYVGCSQEEVLEAIEASYGFKPISLDTPSTDSSEDSGYLLLDKLGEEQKGYSDVVYNDFLKKFVEKLNDLEKKVFEDRFFNEKTQSEIGRELDISQMSVSRIEKKVIDKLKKEYKKDEDII
ncbi:MAG: SigB/SigF/SigG family RNA polymerase sigma factor [Clostridioides sp.]|jgi:RNA polymerase sigma-B factor|nr:SigB/SigF/SigG family RNA polymerase sigma factor [Clostridioides sp.]